MENPVELEVDPQMENPIEFKVGQETLRGSLFTPQGAGKFPAIIFFHGSGTNREGYLPVSRALVKNGFMVLAFDFRGCGESDGEYESQTYANSIEDAEVALNFLVGQDIDVKRIGVGGSSLGGFIGAYITSLFDIKSLVLRSPPAYRDNIYSELISRDVKDRLSLDSKVFDNIEKFAGNLLLIEAERDEVVPSEVVREYFNRAHAAKSKKHNVIKGAGHGMTEPKQRGELNSAILNWFNETL